MAPEIGHFALALALAMALAQSVLPILGAARGNIMWMQSAKWSSFGQVFFVGIAFLALMQAFVTSDFTVKNVVENSNSLKPMLFKVAGTWGSHEGSLLLWTLILTVFGAAVALFGSNIPLALKARTLSVQAWISVGFLTFMLLTSNPFDRVFPPPGDGQDLNPLLQDVGLAMPPPLLYFGYVGFSIVFSFAVAALIEGRVDAAWARWVRPWTLAAWMSLTAGIALGSWWAYYELGWGGWWFWDPVENVSLMPWLAGTALLHSTLVVEKRNTFMNWTLLLAITTFSLSLIGTFIVRSGVLTSVHAFAVDPERGVYLLGLLGAATGGALVLYAIRASKIASTTTFDAVSREGSLVLNNLLLCAATATVFIGTFYPLIMEALTGEKLTVGPPFFNKTFAPMMIGLVLFMSFGPLLKWRMDDPKRIIKPLIIMVIAAVILGALTMVLGKALWGALSMALAMALFIGALLSFGEKARFGRIPLADSFRLMTRLPAAAFGFLLGHVGLAVTIVGITGMSVWALEDQFTLNPGEVERFGQYEIMLVDVSESEGQNYVRQYAQLNISRNGEEIVQMFPERRFYPVEQNMTTEAELAVYPLETLYSAIGEITETGLQIRFYIHPFVSWIWVGAIIMALGGFISLADARFRVKASRPIPRAAAAPAE